MAERIENTNFIETLSELLASGKDVKIRVSGGSMRPFLKEGRDSVILRRFTENKEIQVGGIVLANNKGSYVLHRVYGKDGDNYKLMGDANIRYGETINKDDIIAYVTAIERNGKTIEIDKSSYRLKSKLWIWSLPVRKPIVILLFSIKGLLKTKTH